MTNHATKEDAQKALLAQLQEMFNGSDRWLGVLFSVEGGRLVMRRTTSDFPDSEWREAIHLLEKEAVRQITTEKTPLPVASRFAVKSGPADDDSLEKEDDAIFDESVPSSY